MDRRGEQRGASPRVTVEAGGDAHGATTTNAAEADSHGGDSKSNAALGLAIAGLAAGLVALGVSLIRRHRDADSR
jgi:hypothetical protein